MSYLKKIEESKRKVYNQAVAQRILDLMDKLRLSSNESDNRRWVWELMQNAKDVAYEKIPVAIAVNFNPDESAPVIEFQHNGQPFSIDNITFLIEQVSTKDRENINGTKPITTGKFGTGFLTTHLLSEMVEVNGIVKEPDLPFKKFNLQLNRKGRIIDEIIASVNESLQLLSSLDEQSIFADFNKTDYNTSFRYYLNDEGTKTAQKGLEDMEISLPYTLSFVPSIKSVTIDNNTIYEVDSETIALTKGIDIFRIQINKGSGDNEIFIAVASNERVQVAIQVKYVSGEYELCFPDSKLPRLFCDFPLIGSEDFNLPVVINSTYFNPTEQRNGVFLSDKTDPKIIENKMLLMEAKELYLKLVEYASTNNWKKMYVLADIDLPKPKDWISGSWMKESIVTTIQNKLLTIPMVDTINFGRIPINCGGFNEFLHPDAIMDFPKHKDKEIIHKLYKLCNNQYFLIPDEKDYQFWAKIIWDKKYEVSLMSIVKLIESKQNMSVLSVKLGMNESDILVWLNDFYNLLSQEGTILKEIASNPIYPNQNGVFKQKEELIKEKGVIPDDLKDIAKDLGDDFRDRLIQNEVNVELNRANFCEPVNVADQIIKLIKPRFSETPRTESSSRIFKKLYLWFNQYPKEAEILFDDLFKNKHKLLDDNEIVSNLKKAETYDELITVEPNLSLERIQELLAIEELSKGFSVDKTYTPDEDQKRRNFENGWKGEAYVYKMLIAQGFEVNWPNKSDVETPNLIVDFEGDTHYIEEKGEKYDLFVTTSGNKKLFIQVKSTTTDITRADEIAMPVSVREWKFVNEKSKEDSYYLARVFNVNSNPEVYFMRVENKINNQF
jgi:hypothetical protein